MFHEKALEIPIIIIIIISVIKVLPLFSAIQSIEYLISIQMHDSIP